MKFPAGPNSLSPGLPGPGRRDELANVTLSEPRDSEPGGDAGLNDIVFRRVPPPRVTFASD
jgi:hypothetical protein